MAENEDTQNDPACLVCGSQEWWDCGHLIVSIDQDYGECQGGIWDDDDRFQQLFAELFLAQIASDPSVKFTHPIMNEMWQDWKLQGADSPEERVCDPYILARLLTEAFEQNGAVLNANVIEGRPGMTQQFVNIFAEKPAEVFEKTYSELNRQLTID